MKKEMPKAYEPGEYEDKIYEEWNKAGFFNPDNLVLEKNAPGYSIVMPPPNVTGTLHLGHASMLAIEDILTRFHRMNGYRALWLPGTDHAAIATQTKVEKIIKEEGETRHSLGREKFLKRVEEFAQDSHDTIVNQVKKMGSSCDWSREAYTLDATRNKAVNSVFKMMYDDGLIYRGERIVNWCPRCHSTLSDDEVEYKAQQGKLYTFKYSKDFPFAVASTRPETKLGDTAVAVNPKDERYKKYIGKTYEVEFAGQPLKLKIISDRQIDKDFGTGALGVTPAHSMIDSLMAEQNDLDIIKVIDEDGKIHDGFGAYSGKDVKIAREMIVEKLKVAGLLEKEEEIENNISLCYRCDTAVEPLPSLQWFIDVNKPLQSRPSAKASEGRLPIDWEGKTIKEVCLEVVKSGKIKILPKRFEKNYYHWMENLRPWCISRQIWYGHRVPVWYRPSADSRKQTAENSRELNFRNREMFDLIKSGNKTVETRALNPEEKYRYFGDINDGDEIILNFIQGDIIKGSLKTRVKKAAQFKNRKELLRVYSIEKIIPGGKDKDLELFQKSIPGYEEEIEKHGLIALELEEVRDYNENVQIFVGVEAPEGKGWTQDEDTLDTWFSSGLWTFSTLANKSDQIRIEDGRLVIDSEDFRNFHPTQVLETGYDILFFWVARMIIMTTYAVGDIPFEDVYLHGLVLDDKGKKMSKSKGNVIDPLDMCEKYGTDATRLSLVIGSTPGNDMRLSEEKIAGFRNFANKLWNIARYILQTASTETARQLEFEKFSVADSWIWDKLRVLIKEVTDDIKQYRFSQAGERLRSFTWDDLADWYLEASKFDKSSEKEKVLIYVLDNLLKLWHPFIPFVTEVIWQEMGHKDKLIVAPWPSYAEVSSYAKATADKSEGKPVDGAKEFEVIKDIITAIRNARAENKVEPGRKVKAVIYAGEHKGLIESQADIIKGLRTGIEKLRIEGTTDSADFNDSADKNGRGGKLYENAIYITVGDIEIYLLGAVDEEKEKARIEKEIANLEKMIKITEKKLANKEFTDKAPEAIVEKEKEKLETWKSELRKLKGAF